MKQGKCVYCGKITEYGIVQNPEETKIKWRCQECEKKIQQRTTEVLKEQGIY